MALGMTDTTTRRKQRVKVGMSVFQLSSRSQNGSEPHNKLELDSIFLQISILSFKWVPHLAKNITLWNRLSCVHCTIFWNFAKLDFWELEKLLKIVLFNALTLIVISKVGCTVCVTQTRSGGHKIRQAFVYYSQINPKNKSKAVWISFDHWIFPIF